jgi:glutathione S-transferase
MSILLLSVLILPHYDCLSLHFLVPADLDLSEFPAVKAWHDKLLARPAVRKGLDVPTKNKFV